MATPLGLHQWSGAEIPRWKGTGTPGEPSYNIDMLAIDTIIRGHTHEGGLTPSTAGAAIDHGSLAGRGDDDHTQYIKHVLGSDAEGDFLQKGSGGTFIRKTVNQVKEALGLDNFDHGTLAAASLSDDDHPQYHNNTRGDARYLSKTSGAENQFWMGDNAGGFVLKSLATLKILLGITSDLGSAAFLSSSTFATSEHTHTEDPMTWTNLSYSNNWATYTSDDAYPLSYAIDSEKGLVYLRGTLKAGIVDTSPNNGDPLPLNARPSKPARLATVFGDSSLSANNAGKKNAPCWIGVGTDGKIKIWDTIEAPQWVLLDGLVFSL